MLDTQFIGANLHFVVNLLAALVAFAVFWLIFDAWTMRHEAKDTFKWVGFLVLSLGFLLRAAAISGSHLGGFVEYLAPGASLLRFAGYIAIIIGQILDPLQQIPESHFADPVTGKRLAKKSAGGFALPFGLSQFSLGRPSFSAIAALLLPVLSALAGGLYLRRATTGLERHLLPVAWGFGVLTIFELLEYAGSFTSTTNPNLYQLVQPFGLVWWASLAALFISALILGIWVWHYLTKRLQTQLFIILVAQTLALFLISTVGFTFLLFQNIQKQSLADLTTASHVLDYAVTSRRAETAAQAEAVAASGTVITAVDAHDHAALATALSGYLAAHNLTSLTVTDNSAAVLLRAEDPQRYGDSRSSDPLVRRALVGAAGSNVLIKDGVTAPAVSLVAGAPIRDSSGSIIGTVIAGRAISNAFVDGIRSSTGLDSAVYGSDIRAATTLLNPGSDDRAIGVKETTPVVIDQVLKRDQSYSGIVNFQSRPYLAAFAPLRDVNNEPVGMLLVAHPESELYDAANRSVQLTFLFVVALILLSVYPVYRISRFLSSQLR
jgi:hypothetical protein